jgi:predicted HTH transcriptional regulator
MVNSHSELNTFAAKLSREQLQEWYNSIPGEAPVKRLRNRPTAIERIWDAMRRMAGIDVPHSEEPIEVELEEVKPAKKERVAKPKPVKSAPKAKAAKVAKPEEPANPVATRSGTKREQLIAMVSRKSGASMDELTQAFGWQKHTVRGLLSTLNASGAIHTSTSKNAAGVAVYQAVS